MKCIYLTDLRENEAKWSGSGLTAATKAVATKNSSSDAFFKIRDVVYEVVSERVKKWFNSGGKGQIEDIAVTLDKVKIPITLLFFNFVSGYNTEDLLHCPAHLFFL